MKELETLLNTLLKMGWKPWGRYIDKITIPPKEQFDRDRYLFVDVLFPSGFSRYYTQRELVSINSGLWQFCAENDLLNINKRNTEVYRKAYFPSETEETIASDSDYKYRLLESALIPDDELAEFLVDNIKIEGITN